MGVSLWMALARWCTSCRVIKRLGDFSAESAFVDQKTTKSTHKKAYYVKLFMCSLIFLYKSYIYDHFLDSGEHIVVFCSQVYPPFYTCLLGKGVSPQIAYALWASRHKSNSYCFDKNPDLE